MPDIGLGSLLRYLKPPYRATAIGYTPTPLLYGREYLKDTPVRKLAESTKFEVKINATLIKSSLYYFRVLGLAVLKGFDGCRRVFKILKGFLAF